MDLFPACEQLRTIWLASVRNISNLKMQWKKMLIFGFTHLRSQKGASQHRATSLLSALLTISVQHLLRKYSTSSNESINIDFSKMTRTIVLLVVTNVYAAQSQND